MLSVKEVRKWKRLEGEDRTPLWRISLFRRWKFSGDPIQGSMKAHVVTHVSLHPCQTIGTASDSGNKAASLRSNLAEKYNMSEYDASITDSCHRSYWNWWHRYSSGRSHKCYAFSHWQKLQLGMQLSNAAVEITKSMPSSTWSVTFSKNTWKHPGKVKS